MSSITCFSILRTRWWTSMGRRLRLWQQSKLLRERSRVIAEHQKKFDPGDAFGELRRYRKLMQGDGGLSFYRQLC